VEAVTADAMQTPDGAGRVEVVHRGHTHWYRIVHGDNQLDWLTIAAVQRLLGEAGIDMADLIEVTDQPAGPPSSPSTYGSGGPRSPAGHDASETHPDNRSR
jgi:hypothetical protein